MQWQRRTIAETLAELHVSPDSGLTDAEAALRLRQDGANRLRAAKRPSVLAMFLGQFRDFMVIILLIAAGISFLVSFWEPDGDLVDPIIILGIVVLNAIIGTVQECKAEKAIESLQKMAAPTSHVRRSGALRTIPSEQVVRGDIVFLREGDRVPADGRLIESVGLRTEESALTGESFPVEKDAQQLFSEREPVAERRNMVFSGTSVAAGHGWAVVTETGMRTEMGQIAQMLTEGDAPQTPLQVRLAKIGRILGIGALVICASIFAMGLIQHSDPLNMFLIAVSLAVAAIPEGLPAIVTIVLALGVRRMAAQRAIIRRLPAVETLGCATVICSDKTGTLTQNRMTVTTMCDAFGTVEPDSPAGQRLMQMAALCSNATPGDGDPTEQALLRAVQPSGAVAEWRQQYPRAGELPFDSDRKRMTTVHRSGAQYWRITKGAPEILLALCTQCRAGGAILPMTEDVRERICTQIRTLSEQALRVIAFADGEGPSAEPTEAGLCFAGMMGMMDPPRPEAADSVRRCRRAGIRPVMITGDHAATAAAIGRQLGICRAEDRVLTGAQLDTMSDDALAAAAADCPVYARVSPAHKVRIVRALQSRGAVVAMTGDGVNDAPALKAADIGCAMGESGTDVAKDAADMILTDDRFTTIVDAVAAGRGIYANIQKAVHFLLSCNIGEIMTVFVSFLLHLPSPLLAIQLLWVNLVTDSLPALALGVEPMERDVMQRKPIHRSQSLFAGLTHRILLEGLLIGSISLLAYICGRSFFDANPAVPVVGRTMAFAVLSLSQLVHAFNVRSPHSLFQVGIASNRKMIGAFLVGLLMQVSVITIPALAAIFKTAALSPLQWGIVALLSFVPLGAVELEKMLCA